MQKLLQGSEVRVGLELSVVFYLFIYRLVVLSFECCVSSAFCGYRGTMLISNY